MTRLLWTTPAVGTLLMLAAAANAQFTPASGSPFTVGSHPHSVAVGDFNNDGNLDLAIANAGTNNVAVLLGNGTGGFTPASGSPFTVGSNPVSVAVGDFNGDGKLDLAVANLSGSNVTVLLGNGAGGFSAAYGSPFSTGGNPAFVAVGDFNGDGKLDLAIANSGSGTVTVLLGDGMGGFTAAPGSPFTAGSNPVSLAVGDFNGDGRPDLAIANAGSGNVTVLLGKATGGFSTATGSPFTVGSAPYSVAVGDFNGDGNLDLAVANLNSGNVTLLLGNGAGRFTAASGSPFTAGLGPYSVAVGDFNGDGDLDLAIANSNSSNATVLLGDGFGGFTAASGSPFAVGSVPYSVAAGDFNKDGRLDLAVTSYSTNSVAVLLNGFTYPPVVPVLLSPGNGASTVSTIPTLSWSASNGAVSYNVYLGTTSPPPLAANITGTGYSPSQLAVSTTYFWQVVAVNGSGSASSAIWAFTTVPPADLPGAPILLSPGNGATGVSITPTLLWNSSSGAASYDVYFGTSPSPPLVSNTVATGYSPGILPGNQTYYWQIVARNSFGSSGSPTWHFTTGAAPATPLHFIAVTPCRVADTRNAAGPFGGPTMAVGATRTFAIPQSLCNIPSSAQAYSLNVTAVPPGRLGFLSMWPAGQSQPYVSTLNSWGGIVVANAAIVPAGVGGAVSVFVSDPTDVILDINGYFDTTGSALYPLTPCRVADTRNAIGEFGGPSMLGLQTRSFPIPLSSCSIPANPSAYAMNVTVVPSGPLGFLTTWPTGQLLPNVSTLNSWTGKVVANAAIVPAGTNGSISVYVSDPTDVVLDINGYFGLPGNLGALSFYAITPCRVADTRNSNGPFGGPEMGAATTRSFAIPASGCYVPSAAAAYSLNITVVPDAALGFLTAWPAGAAQPYVSTLNSWDGSVVANAAIVPAGTNGAVSIYVSNSTHVIVDINGYFAP